MLRPGILRAPLAGIAVGPLALLCLVVLQIYASTYLLISVLPVHIRGLSGSEANVGWVMGIFSLTALAVRPFAGLLTDRAGRRPAIWLGSVLIGASCLGYVFASPDTMFVARVINGAGWGAVTATTATVAADIAPTNRRGTVLGIYGMTTGFAFAVGPSIGIWFTEHVGLTVTFLLASVCGFGAGIAMLFLKTANPPAKPERRGIRLEHLFSREAAGPAVVMFAFTLVYGTVLTFIPLVTIDRGLGDSGPFFAVFAGALIVLRISGGGLSDRLGRFAVIVPGFLASCLAMITLAFAGSYLPLLAAAILFATAFAFIQPAAQAWAVDLAPGGSRGSALATVIAAQDLGISLGSLVSGVLVESYGYLELFLVAAAVSLVGLLPVVWLRRQPMTAR